MMMNKRMKKILAIGLAVLVMAVPTLSFADEMATPVQRKFSVEDRLNGRLNTSKEGFMERVSQAQEKKDIYRERLTGLINEYTPELLDEFQSFWEAHDSIHEMLLEERERIASEKREEAIAFFEMIKEQFTSGEMTREEVKVDIEAYRAAEKAERHAVKAEIDALKESMDVHEDVVKALHGSLKTAVEAGDGVAVVEILEEMISYQPQHLAFDQAKLELFMTK